MTQTVFITKYALTEGMIECEAIFEGSLRSCYGKPAGFLFSMYFFGNDFHLTKKAALEDCESRKVKKIESLKKQIAKLENMSF